MVAAASANAAPPPQLGVDFGDAFSLNINPRLQARVATELESTRSPSSLNLSAVSIPRLRLKIGGRALQNLVDYKVEFDAADLVLTLKDGFVDVRLHGDAVRVMVGQYKMPFMRQQLLSSARMQFVSRALTDAFYEAGRDVGVTVHGTVLNRRARYDIGLFVGDTDEWTAAGRGLLDARRPAAGIFDDGRYETGSLAHPIVVARLSLFHGDVLDDDENDLSAGPLRFNLAFGGYSRIALDDAVSRSVLYSDFAVTAGGMSVNGSLLVSSSGGATVFESGAESVGGYLQWGLLLGIFEPLARVAHIRTVDAVSDRTEIGGGVVIYFVDHLVKWQTEMIEVRSTDAPREIRLATQLQVAF